MKTARPLCLKCGGQENPPRSLPCSKCATPTFMVARDTEHRTSPGRGEREAGRREALRRAAQMVKQRILRRQAAWVPHDSEDGGARTMDRGRDEEAHEIAKQLEELTRTAEPESRGPLAEAGQPALREAGETSGGSGGGPGAALSPPRPEPATSGVDTLARPSASPAAVSREEWLRSRGWVPDRGAWRLTTGPRVRVYTHDEACKFQLRSDRAKGRAASPIPVPDEVVRLREELAAMTAERDEARANFLRVGLEQAAATQPGVELLRLMKAAELVEADTVVRVARWLDASVTRRYADARLCRGDMEKRLREWAARELAVTAIKLRDGSWLSDLASLDAARSPYREPADTRWSSGMGVSGGDTSKSCEHCLALAGATCLPVCAGRQAWEAGELCASLDAGKEGT